MKDCTRSSNLKSTNVETIVEGNERMKERRKKSNTEAKEKRKKKNNRNEKKLTTIEKREKAKI